MDIQSLIVFCMEVAGTIAFAASGAMVGIRRGMDIFGICVLGVVTSVGGGMTRDIILG
ncbi:MAG: TRIC cation channel family protein, partial [Lachnospiraceae bacterium]|nr:TRIC cation channel family protein [Lachnospiraceae bacterium]